MDPSKKVPDLNCEVQDLLLEVVDLKQEVPDLRSGGIPLPQFNPWRGKGNMTISYCTAAALCTIHKLIQRAVLKMIQVLVDVIIKIPLCSCFFIWDHIACGMMRVGVMMGVCVFLHAYACTLCRSLLVYIRFLVPVPTIAWKNTCPVRLPIFMSKETSSRPTAHHVCPLQKNRKQIESTPAVQTTI